MTCLDGPALGTATVEINTIAVLRDQQGTF